MEGFVSHASYCTIRIVLLVAALAPTWTGCWADIQPTAATLESVPVDLEGPITYTAQEPVVPRLSAGQYANVLADLFGPELIAPDAIEPDTAQAGFIAIGSALAAMSARGVEQFEAAAFDIAEQALGTPEIRDRLVDCTPAGPVDDDCARETLATLGLRAWRRPLTETQLERLVGVAAVAGETLDDFDAGLAYAIAGLMQSPYFIYRIELGEDAPDGGLRYTDYEMASRLSFFLWNTSPDDELLEAASRGELTDEATLEGHVRRLLESDRTREGVANFFTEMLELYELDHLSKDPTRFPHMSPDVGPSAARETLLSVDHLVFDLEGDYRDLFTTRRTFLNRKLAAIYAVPAPSREGFAETELPADQPRRGLLGQLSFLALHSHPTASSATLRGAFVREVLLCQAVPAPPAGVDTSIPEPSPDLPTLRDRMAIHNESPSCSGCHLFTDGIGLGLENFDGIGRYRLTESDVLIDATGELDGHTFSNPIELADVVADHPDLTSCLVESMYRYATNRVDGSGEEQLIRRLDDRFTAAEYRVLDLMFDIAMSPGFRRLGEITVSDEGDDNE